MLTDIKKIQELRRKLHTIPEPSMQEHKTKQLLMDFLRRNTGLTVVDRGEWFYAHYRGNNTGDAIAFRAEYQEEYEELVKTIQQRAEQKSMEQGMTCRIRLIEPFRWSEDFGYYLQKTKGAFWGVGTGENCSGLHTAEYEFDDAIIGTVIDIYAKLMTIPHPHFPYHAETHLQ